MTAQQKPKPRPQPPVDPISAAWQRLIIRNLSGKKD
jgi:hypothetical protein